MTKQQTIDQIKNSLPGFYSAEQVIEMLTKIEEPKATLDEKFIDAFSNEFQYKLDRNPMDYIDTDTAEFELCGNQIQLDSVTFFTGDIAELAKDILQEMLTELSEG
jgi:hypothetical protein